jgi:hypothetical protein
MKRTALALLLALGIDAQTVVVKGKDGAVWMKDGSADWVALEGVVGGAPDVCRAANGDLFVAVLGTDDGVWLKSRRGSEWSAWTALSGRMTSDVSIICMPDSTPRIFARTHDQQLAVHTPDPLKPWDKLGQIDGAPEIAVSTKGVIDVVMRSSDGTVWHTHFDGAWSPWRSLGVRTDDTPAIARLSDSRLDVIVTQNGVAHHGTVPESGAMTVKAMGGAIVGSPDASSIGDGRMDVVARGKDGTVQRNTFDGKRWSGWKSLGGEAASDPSVAAPPAPRTRLTKS